MSDSVRPHRWPPTRLPRPWDSQGKNTGVGCHFLLQCMKVKSGSEVAQSCPTLSEPMDCSPPGSPVHGIFQARVLEWGALAFSEKGLVRHYGSNESINPVVLKLSWPIRITCGAPVLASLVAQTIKNLPAIQETQVPGLGRSPGEGNGYPLQYSCPENSMGRRAWQAIVHGVAKSQI